MVDNIPLCGSTAPLVIALTVLATCGGAADDAPKASADPLLKTFVDEFIEITPGRDMFPQSFEMGSSERAEERPVHTVTFACPFNIARYEVPQNLYKAIMGHNASRWKGPRNSAERMTWDEARGFCRRITVLLRKTDFIAEDEVIRLPTEAEWEYCCRAGTTTTYSFGDSATRPADTGNRASLLDDYAWHTGNAAGNDPPVGALRPNAWGLYDMHGYLWEFCADAWHDDYGGAPTDGTVWTSDDKQPRRVIRGGSWRDSYRDLRSASRKPVAPQTRDDTIGFRCVKSRER